MRAGTSLLESMSKPASRAWCVLDLADGPGPGGVLRRLRREPGVGRGRCRGLGCRRALAGRRARRGGEQRNGRHSGDGCADEVFAHEILPVIGTRTLVGAFPSVPCRSTTWLL